VLLLQILFSGIRRYLNLFLRVANATLSHCCTNASISYKGSTFLLTVYLIVGAYVDTMVHNVRDIDAAFFEASAECNMKIVTPMSAYTCT